MSFVLSILFWTLASLVVIGTVLPLTSSVRWWVRIWEFPRVHIAGVALGLALLSMVLPVPYRLALICIMLACAAYQAVRIWPYTRFASIEVAFCHSPPKDQQISILAANVLKENTRFGELNAIIAREDPDILFLMETDETWKDALHQTLGRYPTVLTYPLDNYYGLIFATRLEAPRAEVVFLSDDNTPSIQAELVSPDGRSFNFIGLHPRPPVPGNHTRDRDAEIKRAAMISEKARWPTLCIGDFNDVAWSWTSQRFKRIGGFVEPRIGRGMFSTFHAKYPFLRVPIDQIYFTPDIGLVSFSRLEYFGSDHFPLKVTVTLERS